MSHQLDSIDPLGHYRKRFKIKEASLIYLDGNSLGRLPKDTSAVISKVVEHQWGKRLIRSWNEGWYELSSQLATKLSPIIGAKADEVIFTDSTSQNLFKLITAALRYKNERTKIVSDVFNFPSDVYLLQGIKDLFGDRHKIVLTGKPDSIEMNYDELFREIDEDTALVTLSHVTFKSAFMYDMRKVTDYAQEKGALVLWDLSHSAGAIPVKLNECKVDMAVGCSYKYLNGGPGAPAFLYVREDLQDKLSSPVWGWFGEENPFDFSLKYRPAKGIRKFLAGTPPVLSLSAIEPALDMILEAGMDKIREKSINQSNYLLDLAKTTLFPLGFSSGSPENHENRGSHISLQHPEAFRICQAMIDPEVGDFSVIPDFREPNNIRLGITPLYTSYQEIQDAVLHMEKIVKDKIYKSYSDRREGVT